MVNTADSQASIGNGQSLNVNAAAYYNALVSLIKKETNISIIATEGTRTYARQLELYNLYRAGKGNPAYAPNSPYAYHMSGRAVDVGSGVGYVNTEAAKAWRARMGPYGFRETVAGEPWHFEFRAEWASVDLNAVEQEDKQPLEIEDDMVRIINVDGDYWVVDFGNRTKWNISAGTSSVAAAFARMDWMRNVGVRVVEGPQPPTVLAGFRDITNLA